MSVNPKEKAMLQSMWQSAKTASADLPDGTYQFVILGARFHMSDKGRPQFKTKLRVKGGAEEYVGKELEINDNLETPENMGWFKKKLSRLNVATPEDFDEITDGTLAEHITGKIFEGQVKTKNDFINVYVNRLLGEDSSIGSGEESVSKDTREEPVSEDTETEGLKFDEGDVVEWNDKVGTVVEALDDGKFRVKAGDGKVYRVEGSILSLSENEAEQEEVDGGAEEEKTDEVEIPSPVDVESMPAPEVKKALASIGLEASKIKQPRAVLHGIATLLEDPKAKIELTEISPLAEALGVAVKKGANVKDTLRAIGTAVQERFN